MTEKCAGILSPLIVLPHQTSLAITRTLLEQAKRELASANELTIIGYSFPEYDIAIRALFRDHMKKNTKIEIVDVTKPENQTVFERRFAAIFGSREILFSYDGFEGYLNRSSIASKME